MGLFHRDTSEAKLNMNYLDLEHGWVWMVYRIDNLGTKDEAWHLQGVAGTEKLATEICLDETYVIGPVPLNVALPEKRLEWAGAKFPLKDKPVTTTQE